MDRTSDHRSGARRLLGLRLSRGMDRGHAPARRSVLGERVVLVRARSSRNDRLRAHLCQLLAAWGGARPSRPAPGAALLRRGVPGRAARAHRVRATPASDRDPDRNRNRRGHQLQSGRVVAAPTATGRPPADLVDRTQRVAVRTHRTRSVHERRPDPSALAHRGEKGSGGPSRSHITHALRAKRASRRAPRDGVDRAGLPVPAGTMGPQISPSVGCGWSSGYSWPLCSGRSSVCTVGFARKSGWSSSGFVPRSEGKAA